MDGTKPIRTAGPTVGVRSPLSNRSNLNVSRRWDHKDSSESQPSTHDSLYDAAPVSPPTSDCAKSPYQTPFPRPSPSPETSPEASPSRLVDLNSESPLSRLETPFLYGYGTELAPIIEQRSSIATLRTGSLSTSDLSSLMHGAPPSAADSTTPLRQHHNLRRQRSFSLDDLTLPAMNGKTRIRIPSKRQGEPRLSSLIYSKPAVEVTDVHAYPQKPVYPAHKAPRTPPSFAEWIVEQQRQQQSSGADELAQTSVSYDMGMPAFRGPRSGHGNLSAHPFMRREGEGGHRVTPGPADAPPSSGVPETSTDRVGDGQDGGARLRRGRARGRDQDLAQHPTDVWTCKTCQRPRNDWWSLSSSIAGHGPGARRGKDWCTRCAIRRFCRVWCCKIK
ncbi:Uu.00g063180.m01.CDS01 [Anthostomella pinea]|uniref:Uu.00g063180.m01.CDS01 n=1 Tax=Anthostomella pinea TaxID=933095 RepID=A0AAI8VUJ7_9PEZI|nr:Uu.00g063180.m01.CDS01 [Anthostomella pinea]